MVEALEHVANLERPAKRCRLVERHRDAAIDLEEDPDDEELAQASAASADSIKGLDHAQAMADHGCPLHTWQSTAPSHGYDANRNDRCNGQW